MTPRSLLRDTVLLFLKEGIPDPETDSALLLSSIVHRPPLELRIDSESVLPDTVVEQYNRLVSARLRRFPLQYLLSEAPFCGRFFYVDQRVLIPRPETELLCEWALDDLKKTESPKVLDLCCGSGCIGLTIKAERPDADLVLSDISSDALDVSRINADRLGLSVETRLGDLLDGISSGSFDLIVCNPPYIPSESCGSLQAEVLFEPIAALDGGTDGLSLYRRLIPEAKQTVIPGGTLMLELGQGESGPVSDLLSAAGFSGIEVRQDLNGIDRMILARMN